MDEVENDIYDFIILGTGFQQSLLSGALSRCGKKVLHLETNDFYGEAHTSLDLKQFAHVLGLAASANGDNHDGDRSNRVPGLCVPAHLVTANGSCSTDNEPGGRQETVDQHGDGPVTASSEQPSHADETDLFSHWLDDPKLARAFSLSFTVRLVFSTSPLLNLLIRSGTHKYLEFMSMSKALSVNPGNDGGFCLPVPDSRAAVFTSTFLSLKDKRSLMRALSLPAFLGADQETRDAGVTALCQQYAGFPQFLDSLSLSPTLRILIQFCLAFDHPADSTSSAPTPSTSTADFRSNLEKMQKYIKSVGVYGPSPFLIPLYGSGEIAQAFARLSAVYGCVFMLRQKIAAIHTAPSSITATHFKVRPEPEQERGMSEQPEKVGGAPAAERAEQDEGHDSSISPETMPAERTEEPDAIPSAAPPLEVTAAEQRKLDEEKQARIKEAAARRNSLRECSTPLAVGSRNERRAHVSLPGNSEFCGVTVDRGADQPPCFFQGRKLIASSAYLPDCWFETRQIVYHAIIISREPLLAGSNSADSADARASEATAAQSVFMAIPPNAPPSSPLCTTPSYAIQYPPAVKVCPRDHFITHIVSVGQFAGQAQDGGALAEEETDGAGTERARAALEPVVAKLERESGGAHALATVYFARRARAPVAQDQQTCHNVFPVADPVFSLSFDREVLETERLFHALLNDGERADDSPATPFMEQVPDPEDIVFG